MSNFGVIYGSHDDVAGFTVARSAGGAGGDGDVGLSVEIKLNLLSNLIHLILILLV